MTELRWSLIAVGVIVIFGIYAWSRRGGGSDAIDPARERREPDMRGLGMPPTTQIQPVSAPEDPDLAESMAAPVEPATVSDPVADTASRPPQPEPIVADKIVKLHLVAKEDAPFSAAHIVAALRAEGLRFAHFDLFHRFAGEGNPGPDARPLFSVSDMLKPGTFDLETLSDKTMRGISLFLVLPNPGDAVAVFADMLAIGRRLAATLGGQLVDNQGCTVSRQSASHMREDIIQYQLSLRTQPGADDSTD